MNAAKTIQAAIDKLEQQRDAANDNVTRGTWIARAADAGSATLLIDYGADEHDEPQVIADEVYQAVADLIVTLHATIDAQLSMLGHTLNFVNSTRGAHSHQGPGIDLARAILGAQATDA